MDAAATKVNPFPQFTGFIDSAMAKRQWFDRHAAACVSLSSRQVKELTTPAHVEQIRIYWQEKIQGRQNAYPVT